MLTVTAICDLYAYLYADQTAPDGTWDHVLPVDGAYTAIKRIEGIDYVMFRGSVTLMDWIEDFKDCALPFQDPVLGDVHPGARGGVLQVKDQIDGLVGEQVVLVGHSLGAMHAAIYGGYRVAEGRPLNALVLFGEPRTGAVKLSTILANTHLQSFRNADKDGHDIVTDVARSIPPMLPYQHVRDPLTDVWRSPNPLDPLLAFRYHHFSLYAKAFGAAGPAVLALP